MNELGLCPRLLASMVPILGLVWGCSGKSDAGREGLEDSGVCAGLQGEWNLTPTVTQSIWQSSGSAAPQVGDVRNSIGVTFFPEADSCRIALRPNWEREVVAEMKLSSGGLRYESSDEQTWATGSSETWHLQQIAVTPGATPTLTITSQMDHLMDDIMETGTVIIGGVLSPVGPEVHLVGFGLLDAGANWCWNPITANSNTTVMPWDTLNVKTSQPVTDLIHHLVVTANGQTVALPWSNPTESMDVNRLASATTTSWDTIMGKTLQVALGTGVGQVAEFNVPQVVLSDGFLGDSLEQLATSGARALDTVNGAKALHLTGSSCTSGVTAAGRVHVTGLQQVLFSLQVNAATGTQPGIAARIINSNNTAVTAQLVSTEGAPVRVYTASLNGQDEVGVQLTASGGCQMLNWWNPDIELMSISGQ